MIQQTHANTPFIRKLNHILHDPQYHDLIRWDSTGTMIDILDQKKIQSELLPKFFRHTKFQSFIRQLNLYGFKKIKKANCHRFKHSNLVKGNSIFSIKSQRKGKNLKNETEQRIQGSQERISQNNEQKKITHVQNDEKSSQKREQNFGTNNYLQNLKNWFIERNQMASPYQNYLNLNFFHNSSFGFQPLFGSFPQNLNTEVQTFSNMYFYN